MAETHANITDHDTYLDDVPHATFERLRHEEPVAWIDETDGSGFWAVTKYDDVVAVSKDYERFTCTRGIRLEEMDEEELEARRSMMEYDPPEHSRLRRIVQPSFSRKTVQSYEAAFRAITRKRLDQVLGAGERELDFVTEIARELPIRILCRLLGVPDEDSDQLVDWGDQMISNADPEYSKAVVDQVDTDEYRLLPFRSPAGVEVYRYAEKIAEARRAEPKDDVLSQLLPLTDLEFKNFFALLMVAGNETTRHTISHGLLALMEHPYQMQELKENLDLATTATEEILRWSTVTMHFRRTATRDTEIRGVPIEAGDKVVLQYISANYDDEAFPEPYRFDIRREPNEHVTFGVGHHVCLGAWLARLEIRVTFEELLPRLAEIELTGPVERLRSNFIRGIKHLPVRVKLA